VRPRQRRPDAPAGFCAAVVAENIGPARHLAVAPNGDLYVSTRNGGRGAAGGVVALHDSDGDGKMDKREKFGTDGATGVALRNGYVYYATTKSIVRQKLTPGQLAPTGPPEVIAEGLTDRRQHADKGIAFDGKGGVYQHRGAVNACQVQITATEDRRPGSCQLLSYRRHLALRREHSVETG
jgi:glucose/arabinose dehydrogenase